VLLDFQVELASLDLLVLLAVQVYLVQLDYLVRLAFLVLLVPLELRVVLVTLDRLGRLVHRGNQETLGQLVNRVRKVRRAQSELLAAQVGQVPLARLDL